MNKSYHIHNTLHTCTHAHNTHMYTPHMYIQVEVWLNRLLETMQSTIRHEMTEAVVSYEEKPRDQWLFEPPAQVHKPLLAVCTHESMLQLQVV